MGKELR